MLTPVKLMAHGPRFRPAGGADRNEHGGGKSLKDLVDLCSRFVGVNMLMPSRFIAALNVSEPADLVWRTVRNGSYSEPMNFRYKPLL
jgi:hypothetical protein